MGYDKTKTHKLKIGLIIAVLVFIIGIIFMTKITDLFVGTDEIEAAVVETYETQSSIHTHNPGGWKMNIEWLDLEGTVHTEGNLANKDGLDVGDTCIISVDAKTHSRRVPSKVGSILMFVIGVCFCGGSLAYAKVVLGFGNNKYKNK